MKKAKLAKFGITFETAKSNYAGICTQGLPRAEKKFIADVKETFIIKGVYPNPTNSSSKLHFTVDDYEVTHFSLFNSLGQLVKEFSYNSIPGDNKIEIGMYEFPSGVYYLRINHGLIWKSIKIVNLK